MSIDNQLSDQDDHWCYEHCADDEGRSGDGLLLVRIADTVVIAGVRGLARADPVGNQDAEGRY